jgi:hypothetical protein
MQRFGSKMRMKRGKIKASYRWFSQHAPEDIPDISEQAEQKKDVSAK